MASKLRVRFRERQCKHLSESIAVNPTPSKKACPKPLSVPPLVSVPPTTVAAITLESDEKLPSANDIAYHEIRRPFFVPDNISEELFEYMNSSPSRSKSAYVPSLEEVFELLKWIPSFTEREPPIQNMSVLFPATQRILIKIDDNLNWSFMTQIPYGTPDTAIARIIHRQDYTDFETAKVVSHLPIFCLFFLSLLFYYNSLAAP